MKREIRRASRLTMLVALCVCCFQSRHAAVAETVDFGLDRWIFKNAEVKEYLGRKCLHGYALLKDVVFENGVIEVDLAVTGASSYPGFVFRVRSDGDMSVYTCDRTGPGSIRTRFSTRPCSTVSRGGSSTMEGDSRRVSSCRTINGFT